MKRRDLESRVAVLGWQLARHGGSHDVWTKTDKAHVLAIPRHAEINEHTVKAILRDAAR